MFGACRIFFIICVFFGVLNAQDSLAIESKDIESKTDSTNSTQDSNKEEIKAKKQLQKDIKKAKKQKPLSIINDSNPYDIDYLTLDKKYFPFIERDSNFYDSNIKEVIRKVDLAEKKSGAFIGILYGANVNCYITDYTCLINNPAFNFLYFGLRLGYQNYLGSVLPINKFGYQIYIDINSSFERHAVFSTAANIGLLYDAFDSKNGKFGIGIYFDLGFGSAKITSAPNNIYEFAAKVNLGLSMRFFGHSKLNFSLINTTIGLQTLFVSITPSVGYDYVF